MLRLTSLRADLPTRPHLLAAVAVVIGTVALAVAGSTGTLDEGFALGALGVICSLVAGAIFWRHGGRRVTAAGIFALATVIFVGVSAVWWSVRDFESSAIVIVAVVTGWLALVWTFFWHDSDPGSDLATRPVTDEGGPALQMAPGLGRLMIGAGLVLSIVFGAATKFDYFFSATVPFQLALGAMVLLVSAVLLSVGAGWHPLLQLVFVVAVVGVAAVAVFNAYGRLNLVTLGLVGVVLVSHAARAAWLKPLMLAGVGPALLVFSWMRQRYIEEAYGVTTFGAASVFTPLRDAAELYDRVRTGVVDYDYGESFLVAAIFWVPRALWEGKPEGLGAVLVDALGRSATAPEEQSYAALFIGEWFFAGGWLALVLSVVLVGLLVRLLDRWVVRLADAPRPDDGVWFLSLTLSLILVSELANYVWVGSFGYTNRVVLRGATIVFVLVAWLVLRRWRSRATAGGR